MSDPVTVTSDNDVAEFNLGIALKRAGRWENTLIVYFHDNGACSEHLSGNGWNTANNVLQWAKANGKR